MERKILITGAAGNVGLEVVRAFPDKSLLRCAVFNVDHDKQVLGNEVETVYFDFEDPSTYPDAFENVRAVFLMRPPQISNVKKYIVPAIEAAKAAGVEHIVFLSLVGVENNHIVPHYKIEQAILQSGLDWTFLRASFFMQNLNTTHRSEIRERHEIAVPVSSSKTSFIDVRDIGAVAVKTLLETEHRNRAYTLTGGVSIDYYAVAETLSDVLHQILPIPIPLCCNLYGSNWGQVVR